MAQTNNEIQANWSMLPVIRALQSSLPRITARNAGLNLLQTREQLFPVTFLGSEGGARRTCGIARALQTS